MLRDRSLLIGRGGGGGYKISGGGVKFYPYKKAGVRKRVSHGVGGHTFIEVVLMQDS